MMDDGENFAPNWFSAPGETIREAMQERSISPSQLATLLNAPEQSVWELLNGRRAIDDTTAVALNSALGGSPHFWLKREADFQRDLQRCASRIDSNRATPWLASIPAKAMRQMGWIRPSTDGDLLASCLAFFGVTNLDAWHDRYDRELKAVAFRTSKTRKTEPGAVVSWLRYGELLSADIQCESWNRERFRASLVDIKRLTRKKNPAEFLPELRKICAESGVAIVVADTPVGCPASGATKFLSPNKAMLLLSFRYMRDDHFWFTFFHEAGHLVLHSKDALFVERDDQSLMDEQAEAEANQFAFDTLIPPKLQPGLRTVRLNIEAIIKFARACGVAPGIVVGQLQHTGRLAPSAMNRARRKYTWDKIAS